MLELQQAEQSNCANTGSPAEKQCFNILLVSPDPGCGEGGCHAQYLFRNSPTCSLDF